VADQASSEVENFQDPVAAIAAGLSEAACHTADALPELLVLARGGDRFATRARPYLNEVIHCLASALEAALVASHDAERAGIGAARKDGEGALAVVVRDFLDRSPA
jgi:hypothetical protein